MDAVTGLLYVGNGQYYDPLDAPAAVPGGRITQTQQDQVLARLDAPFHPSKPEL